MLTVLVSWAFFHLAQATSISDIRSSQWRSLNKSVNGRLSEGIPTAAACYLRLNGQTNPHVDLVKCAALQAGNKDTLYLASQFGSYENYNFGTCMSKGQGCPLNQINVTRPLSGNCNQGSISNMYITVNSVSDVQRGLAFASKHSLPFVIKNSGHDFRGRSAMAGSLALWMHKLQPAMKFETDFIPAGCNGPIGNVITYGAGQDTLGLQTFAASHNSAVVSATSYGVGPAGGWFQGGGHSPLSPMYGLGVDNIYQFKAVLPNGTYITASKCQNPELFWAFRGGGGGTFGVVTEVSQIAHPSTGYIFAQFVIPELNTTSSKRFLQICIENAEKWASEGFGGYTFPGGFGNHTALLFLVSPKLSLDEARESLKPMSDFATSVLQGNVGVANIQQYPTYDIPYSIMAGADEMSRGTSNALASRIVPVENFRGSDNQTKLLDTMWPIANSFSSSQQMPLYICMTAPWGYVPGQNVAESSVTPAWRQGLWHVIGVNTYSNTADASTTSQAFKHVQDVLAPLRDLTPDSGAYQNEADTFEPDPVASFWGKENYAKLLKIKKDVDPSNLLTCNRCVGWDEGDARLGCYPDL